MNGQIWYCFVFVQIDMRTSLASSPLNNLDLVVRSPASGTIFAITAASAMPTIQVQVEVVGVEPDPTPSLTFTCTTAITFNARQCPHGPDRHFDDSSVTRAQGGLFAVTFPDIRGGKLALTVSTQFQGQDLSKEIPNLTIIGLNPPPADVKAIMPHLTLKKIAMQESGFRQFVPLSGIGPLLCPYWSRDNQGGVGVMQITNPPPRDEEVWSWPANVRRGQQIFSQKTSAARSYPATLSRRAEFQSLVNLYNERRMANNMPPIHIRVPDFDTGDFDANPHQMELDAIRGYNGWGGHDQFGMPLHEYRVAVDADGYLIVDIDASGNNGTVRWERVPPSDRPVTFGNPDYVRMVLSQRP